MRLLRYFNSIKVQLERLYFVYDNRFYFYFNSIKVQLELARLYSILSL